MRECDAVSYQEFDTSAWTRAKGMRPLTGAIGGNDKAAGQQRGTTIRTTNWRPPD